MWLPVAAFWLFDAEVPTGSRIYVPTGAYFQAAEGSSEAAS